MSRPEMTVPGLPPRRPLPPEVRERLRQRVTGGGAVRAPLAAAAAVAVLAAGGMIVAQSTQGDPIAIAPPSATTSRSVGSLPPEDDMTVVASAGGGDAARCGFAVADVRFTIGLPGRRLLVTGDDRFCELTHTAVTHNKPRTVPLANGAASLLWRSGTGVLIGRAPAGTGEVHFSLPVQPDVVVHGRAEQVEDLFLIAHPAGRMSLGFTTPSGTVAGEVDMGALPGPESWEVRQETAPAGDPVVAQCLDAAMQDDEPWVGDPLRWRAGASSAPGVDALLVLLDRATGETAYCHVHHGRGRNADPGRELSRGSLFRLRYTTGADPGAAGAHVLLGGTVDAGRVGGITITDARDRIVPATLADGTFAVRLDDQPAPGGGLPPEGRTRAEGLQLRVVDHQGQVIEAVTLG